MLRCVAVALLASCAARPASTTPAQIPVDLTGVVTTLLRVQPILVMTNGRSFTLVQRRTMEADLNRARKAVSQLSPGMPVDQGRLLAHEADQAIVETVRILAIPSTPALARWTPLIDAVDAVLISVEAFTDDGVVGSNRRVPPMTPEQGRRALGIRTVDP